MRPRQPHLVVDISGHGFGHLGQIAPVLRALAARLPSLRLTVRTAIEPGPLQRILGFPCASAPPAAEAIPQMLGPNTVDAAGTVEAFQAFHAGFAAVVEREAERLAELKPTLLLADVPYSSLAAARRIGIPAIAYSSLDWCDILAAYDGADPRLAPVLVEIADAYDAAALFIQCAPHLPMAWHRRRRSVGPVATVGCDRRAEIATALRCGPQDRLVLVSYGGIPGGFPVDRLPRLPGVRWIFGDRSMGRRDDGINYADLAMPFADVVRSCELAITKPGYGLFAECGCNGTRVLYVERPDWPETPYLTGWIGKVGVAAEIGFDRLMAGDVAEAVRRLLETPRPAPAAPSGIGETVGLLLPFLRC